MEGRGEQSLLCGVDIVPTDGSNTAWPVNGGPHMNINCAKEAQEISFKVSGYAHGICVHNHIYYC